MYRFVYRNKRSGAQVLSHTELHRDELELVKELHVEINKKVAVLKPNEVVTKSEVFEKPKVTRKKRKTKK